MAMSMHALYLNTEMYTKMLKHMGSKLKRTATDLRSKTDRVSSHCENTLDKKNNFKQSTIHNISKSLPYKWIKNSQICTFHKQLRVFRVKGGFRKVFHACRWSSLRIFY
jgi:hypothetical protein